MCVCVCVCIVEDSQRRCKEVTLVGVIVSRGYAHKHAWKGTLRR